MVFFPYLFFGCTAHPDHRLKPGHSRESLKSWPLSDEGAPRTIFWNAWFALHSYSLCQDNLPHTPCAALSLLHLLGPWASSPRSSPAPVCALGLMWKFTCGGVKPVKLTQVLLIRQCEKNRFALNSAVLRFFKRTQKSLASFLLRWWPTPRNYENGSWNLTKGEHDRMGIWRKKWYGLRNFRCS